MKSVSFLLAFVLFSHISWSANRPVNSRGGEKHFLHYKFTVLTKSDTFPEFSAEAVHDDIRIKHFSNEEQVWVLTEEDWKNTPEEPADLIEWFQHQIRTLSDCTHSRCPGHVLQRIIGCELEKRPDGSVNLTVFDDYGFDGEDLISFDYNTAQWIAKNPKAKRIKVEWDRQTGRNQFTKHLLKTCTDWISTYTNRKKMGNWASFETEPQWPLMSVFSAVAAVVVFTLIGYWIYLKKSLNVKVKRRSSSITSDLSSPVFYQEYVPMDLQTGP